MNVSVTALLVCAACGLVPFASPTSPGTAQRMASRQECPAADPQTDAAIRYFFTSPKTDAERTRLGLGGVTVDGVRPLTDSAHSNVCRRFNDLGSGRINDPPESVRTYYQAGTLYLVVRTRDRSDGSMGTAFTPLGIFDRNLKLVGVVGL